MSAAAFLRPRQIAEMVRDVQQELAPGPIGLGEVALPVEIAGYAHKVKACALGQATASVMAARAIGRSRDEIALVADRMAAMLATGGAPPAGDWSALAALAPAKDATSRHGAIMLPFKAVLRAFDEATAAAES